MANEKDIWDKLSIFSTSVASVLLAGLTFFITQHYQQQQAIVDTSLKKIDLLEQLIPSLTVNDSVKNMTAIYIITSLGFDSLASDLAAQVKTPGAMAALKQLSGDTLIPKERRRYYQERWSHFKENRPADGDDTTKSHEAGHYAGEPDNGDPHPQHTDRSKDDYHKAR